MNSQDDFRQEVSNESTHIREHGGCGAASTLFQGNAAAAQSAPKARNVVLVHGLFADESSWSEVIARLQAVGLSDHAGSDRHSQ